MLYSLHVEKVGKRWSIKSEWNYLKPNGKVRKECSLIFALIHFIFYHYHNFHYKALKIDFFSSHVFKNQLKGQVCNVRGHSIVRDTLGPNLKKLLSAVSHFVCKHSVFILICVSQHYIFSNEVELCKSRNSFVIWTMSVCWKK